MKLNSTTAELHNFIYSRNLCIPSEVYDYGSHNSVQCTPVYYIHSSAEPRRRRCWLTRSDRHIGNTYSKQVHRNNIICILCTCPVLSLVSIL